MTDTRTRITSRAALGFLGTGVVAVLALSGCATNASEDSVLTPQASSAATEAGGGVSSPEGSDDESAESQESSQSATTSPREESSEPAPVESKPEGSDEPIFVASLPDTVKAKPGQTIIVQIATEPGTRWKANVNGTATVGNVVYNAPPASQPGAPGTSIANVTAPPAGISYVNFIRVPKNGGATIETARLEVDVS